MHKIRKLFILNFYKLTTNHIFRLPVIGLRMLRSHENYLIFRSPFKKAFKYEKGEANW